MQFDFKKNYEFDLRLVKRGSQRFWYGLLLLAVLLAPYALPSYFVAQATFVLIYGMIGCGLVLLTGHTGLVSLGHAAYVAVGAYTEAYALQRGLPLPAALLLSALMAGMLGLLVGFPALRLRGLYLALATLSFGFIVEVLIARWDSVTGGNSGLAVPKAVLLGHELGAAGFYYLCLALLLVCLVILLNLLRSPTGRALKAIRDSEVSARAMGVDLARFKAFAFALSAMLAGLGGALYAHMITYLSPEQFNLNLSIELIMMIVIGGMVWLQGAFLGAMVVIALPQAIAVAKDYLPAYIGQQTGLQPVIFGFVILFFMLYEPSGLYGRWLKIRTYLELFPLCPSTVFRRERSYQRTQELK